MAIDAGKLRIRSVDMNEIVPFGVDLFKCFTAALGENEMARPAVTRFDRHLAVSRHVFAVVAAEASIPVLVADKIGIRPPIDLHFRKKILPIDRLRYPNDWIRLRWIRISFAQILRDALLRFGSGGIRFDKRGDNLRFHPRRFWIETAGK